MQDQAHIVEPIAEEFMKILFCKATTIGNQIQYLTQGLNSQYRKEGQEHKLLLDPKLGQGTISGFSFHQGISLLLVDIYLEEEIHVQYQDQAAAPIHFHYCLQGSVTLQLGNPTRNYDLDPLMSAISAQQMSAEQTIRFPKETQIQYALLDLHRSSYLGVGPSLLHDLPPEMRMIFQDQSGRIPFLFKTTYSIPTAHCLKQILESPYQGLIRQVFIQAKALELLSLQLKQYEDQSHSANGIFKLKPHDLDRILLAEQILLENLQQAPTILELAKRCGINQQKLKRGFKIVFHKTVNQYLREARLEASRSLLLQGSFTIKEVAAKVGYVNASHFARRFKERYGMLPKNVLRTENLS